MKTKKRKHYGSCGNCSQTVVVRSGLTDKRSLIGKHANNYEKKENRRSCSNMKLYNYFPFLCLPEEIKHRNCIEITPSFYFSLSENFVQFFSVSIQSLNVLLTT